MSFTLNPLRGQCWYVVGKSLIARRRTSVSDGVYTRTRIDLFLVVPTSGHAVTLPSHCQSCSGS